MALLPIFVEDLNALERSCCIAYLGVALYPQAIRRQVRLLELSVFMPYFSHLLPSGWY